MWPAGAVARAYAALRDPPPEAAARASAALSPARLYRSLERQIVALGNVHAGDLPLIGDLPRLYQPAAAGRSPITALAVGLRHAAAGTVAVSREGPAEPPADGIVAVAMRQAYQAVQTAGDILLSNKAGDALMQV